MLLDIRTLLFVMVVSNALIFILIGSSFVARRKEANGISCWLWSYAVQSMGWFLLLLRGVAPDWLTIVVGNSLLFGSLALIFRAICDFVEHPVAWHISIYSMILFLIGLIGLYIYGLTPTAPLVWVSLISGTQGLACAWVLMRGTQWRTEPARWTTGLWLGAGGVVMLLRAMTVHLSHNASYNLYTQSLIQVISFVVAYSAMLGASFGFNLMLQERNVNMLQQIARIDELTGLFNRRYLLDKVRDELNRLERRSSENLILMMIDIDNFKEVNDRYGHAVGDNLLKSLALQLSGILRLPDIVGRYGGEEFCVLLPDTNKAMGLQVAERLRIAASNLQIAIGNEFLQRTISIGVAHTNTTELHDLDNLFLAADRALYQAKEDGRNRIVFADRSMLFATQPTSSSPAYI